MLLGALQTNHADRVVAADQGHAQVRAGRLEHQDGAMLYCFFECSEHQWTARLDDNGGQPCAKRLWLHHDPLVASAEVGHVEQIRLVVEERDGRSLGGEDLPNLLADDVDDRLHVQLLSKRVLDAVDDCQLGRALLQVLADFPLRNGMCR